MQPFLNGKMTTTKNARIELCSKKLKKQSVFLFLRNVISCETRKQASVLLQNRCLFERGGYKFFPDDCHIRCPHRIVSLLPDLPEYMHVRKKYLTDAQIPENNRQKTDAGQLYHSLKILFHSPVFAGYPLSSSPVLPGSRTVDDRIPDIHLELSYRCRYVRSLRTAR